MKPKIVRITSFFLIALIHLIFISAVLLEKIDILPVFLMVIILVCLTSFAYSKVELYHEDHFIENFMAVVFVTAGAVTTYILHHYLKTGPVLAAGIVGTLASFIPAINKKSEVCGLAPTAIYCGCFVGMSSRNVAPDFLFIIFAGITAGIFMVISKGVFRDMGGKLGTIAFGGVAFASLIIFMLF